MFSTSLKFFIQEYCVSERHGWLSGSDWTGFELCTNYSDIKRYKPYKQRLDNIAKNPLINPYKDIRLTIPVISKDEHYLKHANAKYVNNAIKHILEIYTNFTKKFNSKDIKTSQLDDVNNDIAEIRWIMAHATPWEQRKRRNIKRIYESNVQIFGN